MPPVENVEDEVNSRLEDLYGENSITPDLERLTSIMKFLADDQTAGLRANPDFISPHYKILKRARGNFFQRYADNLVPKLVPRVNPQPAILDNMGNRLENLTSEVYTRLERLYGENSRTPDFERLASILTILSNDQTEGLKTNPSYLSPHYENLGKRRGNLFKSYADSLVSVPKSRSIVHFQQETQIVRDDLPDPDQILPALKRPRREADFGDMVVGVSTGFVAGGGSVVMGGIATAYISWECYDNIRKWWKNEISGERCAKNIIDSTLQVVGGIAGGMVGAAVGTAIMPGIGTLFGGVIGGIGSSAASLRLSQYITEKIFNLPPTVALEYAYIFLGVDQFISNGELNTAFRIKCLKFHPDKGGNPEDFHKLQYHFSIIKASREEKNN